MSTGQFLTLFWMHVVGLIALGFVYREINQKTKEELNQMAIDRQTFDNDLAQLISGITNLLNAVNAKIAATPAEDFTSEDTQIQQAAAQVGSALQALNPPATVQVPQVSPAPSA